MRNLRVVRDGGGADSCAGGTGWRGPRAAADEGTREQSWQGQGERKPRHPEAGGCGAGGWCGRCGVHTDPHRGRLSQGACGRRPRSDRPATVRRLPAEGQAAQRARRPIGEDQQERGADQPDAGTRAAARLQVHSERRRRADAGKGEWDALRAADADGRPGSRRLAYQGSRDQSAAPLLARAARGQLPAGVCDAAAQGEEAFGRPRGVILLLARVRGVACRAARSGRHQVACKVLQGPWHVDAA
mmetsp:Transcript_76845/g.230562  ORF Transcript_76845/g.230562 Transcript_76845/m.230562 type:complete len:244 (+) Transcript_76845:109-840(+)